MTTQQALLVILGAAVGVLLLGLACYVGLYRVHGWWVWLRGRDHGRRLFRPGRVYLITVRRPYGARSLVLRRVLAFGYVGQTRHGDYEVRIDQHLYGYLDTPPKWWAPDVVGWRCVYSSQHVTTWGLDFREWLAIKVLFPLHNHTMNLSNPRRVVPPPDVIEQMRTRKRMKHTGPVTTRPKPPRSRPVGRRVRGGAR